MRRTPIPGVKFGKTQREPKIVSQNGLWRTSENDYFNESYCSRLVPLIELTTV